MGALLYTFAIFFAIIAYLGFEYYQILSHGSIMDEFKQSDLSFCSHVPEIKGCEDLAIHHPSGVAFIGCPEDYTLHKNYFSTSYISKHSLVLSSMSFFYSYDLESKKATKLETKGFPSGVKLASMELIYSQILPMPHYCICLRFRTERTERR
ncbi:hypothetical protein DSO57_1028182 [Entomophthora muscae]|uniref:Uncharacterized protein n=1 Tax=Entomophthora muscae TaxID=34485 RepID=A0ACC2RG76_9FUNG|nr:hypothetical protein DSO57_1028182 [Entomophthora muscae]